MTTPRRSHHSGAKTVLKDAESGSTSVLGAWSGRHRVGAFLVLAIILAYPVMNVATLADHGVIPDGWMP
ncbi:hypothetical protein NOCA2210141 [metagenome]|uniref:Uncharacterized protein n=1 Tax=metagenome TaxID=256318 RepID=A0A2P2BYH8_9ZZZZ